MRRVPIALLLVALAAAGAAAPRQGESQPEKASTVECTFANPAFSGLCSVSENVSRKLSARAACTEILSCLNSSQCLKTYCNATTVRGGWTLLKAERRPNGPPVSPVPPPAGSPVPTPRNR